MGALGMHCIKDALKDCHLRAFTSGFLKKISFYILKSYLIYFNTQFYNSSNISFLIYHKQPNTIHYFIIFIHKNTHSHTHTHTHTLSLSLFEATKQPLSLNSIHQIHHCNTTKLKPTATQQIHINHSHHGLADPQQPHPLPSENPHITHTNCPTNPYQPQPKPKPTNCNPQTPQLQPTTIVDKNP